MKKEKEYIRLFGKKIEQINIVKDKILDAVLYVLIENVSWKLA